MLNFRNLFKRKKDMILNVEDRKLIYGMKRKEVFKLTKRQNRVLMLLSDNELHLTEEIRDFALINSCEATRHVIYELRKKIPYLEIQTKNTLGYKLNSIIKIK